MALNSLYCADVPLSNYSLSALAVFSRNALYKSTFYLLYLLTYLLTHSLTHSLPQHFVNVNMLIVLID